jgi:protoheme IX farnesyltransferase
MARAPEIAAASRLSALTPRGFVAQPCSGFVVSTACAGYALGSPDDLQWSGMAWTAAGTWGAAACANALNQVRDMRRHRLQAGCCAPRLTTPLAARQIIEVRNDSLMKRTQRRPLPAGAMSRHHAIAFAVCAGVSGVAILYTQVRALTRSVTCVALG